MGKIVRLGLFACLLLAMSGQVARADDFLPHPSGATWTYFWSDTKYNPQGTTETAAVPTEAASNGCGYEIGWLGETDVPLSSSSSSSGTVPVIAQPDDGTVCFEDQNSGLQNTDYSGSPPPINEPSLCADTSSSCANSLGSTMFDVIWGSRSPVISEPLLQGTTWNGKGGGDGSVTSANRYMGQQVVKVPAFPNGVVADVVDSQIALAGTPGDDYGSGDRTIWWVHGVGPVKLVFDHVDGSVTTSTLQSTNLKAPAPLPDADLFPLRVGVGGTYQWTNSKRLKKPEVVTMKIDAAANRTGRLIVKSVSGPIRAAGEYLFSMRTDGLRTTLASTSAATLLHLPSLGHGRHFFNPADMMIYGFNPVLPDYGLSGTYWHSGNAYDFKQFGVSGHTQVLGARRIHVKAGTFNTTLVRSSLHQKGHAWGSGVRYMWFAAGRGLIKLEFEHADHSTSVVQLIK